MKSKITQTRMTWKTFTSLKEGYSPTSDGSCLFLSADGTKLISEKNKILERWAEHFDGVFSWPPSINDKAIEQLPQVPANESMPLQHWGKFRYLSVNYPETKYPDLTQFLRKSIRRVDQHWWVNFWTSFSWYGWKNNCCRTSRTPPSSIFTDGKWTDRHAIINTESPYFQFQARF